MRFIVKCLPFKTKFYFHSGRPPKFQLEIGLVVSNIKVFNKENYVFLNNIIMKAINM